MDKRLVDLYVQRGRLRERIGVERVQFAHELAPLGEVLHSVDRARALLHRTGLWISAHPGIVAAAAVVVVVWKPRAVIRSARWGFTIWRNWAQWREWARTGLRSF